MLSYVASSQESVTANLAALDTIPGKIKKEIKRGRQKIFSLGKNTIALPHNPANQLLQQGKGKIDSLLSIKKELSGLITSKVPLFKPGDQFFKFNQTKLSVSHSYLGDTESTSNGTTLRNINSLFGYDAEFGLSVGQMPFEAAIKGNNGLYNFNSTPFNNLNQFNFNHKAYLEKLQKLALEKISPDVVLASVLSRINSIKTQYESSLKKEIQSVQQEYEKKYEGEINLPDGVTDLSANDIAGLKTKLFSGELLSKYTQANTIVSQFIKEDINTSPVKDSIYKAALSDVKKYEALEKIFLKIATWKTRFEDNSIVKELKANLPFNPGNFKNYIKKPGNLSDVLNENASLGTFQRLFVNITKLDIGSNPLEGGALNFQNVLNNGINTEFTNKRSSIGFITGNGNPNINNLTQSGLNSFVSNEYSRLTGIKLGSGWNSSIKQSLSLNLFDFNASGNVTNADPSTLQSGYIASPPRRDAVLTWHSSINTIAGQKLSVDISKSFGEYRNKLSGDSTTNKTNAFGNIFSNDGKSNYAASIEYSGNIFQSNFQFSFKKAGLGYNNPGSVFVRKGETSIGFSIDKKLVKQRLSIKYKTNFRSQHFDPLKRYVYNNFSNHLQAGFKINRNNKVQLIYRQNSYRVNNKNENIITKGGSSFLQANANYALHIKEKKLINTFSLAYQDFKVPLVNNEKYISSNWIINYSSSVILKENLLTLVTAFNKSSNQDYYFNTSVFNTELAYSFSVWNKLKLNTGMGYYSNTGWNKQLGIKQQIGGTIFKNIDIDFEVTYKKAIQIIRPELANQVYMNSTIRLAL
ncbi:MAG TPA: hypothetical protein VFN30_04255 [Chitinophagaceae bacterium]|nr:hypothetical protein [Chitinophagaceae bacterium]